MFSTTLLLLALSITPQSMITRHDLESFAQDIYTADTVSFGGCYVMRQAVLFPVITSKIYVNNNKKVIELKEWTAEISWKHWLIDLYLSNVLQRSI